MRVYYADSSVLAKRHLDETGSNWFHDLNESQENQIMTVRLSVVELFSALNRRVREGYLSGSRYVQVVTDIADLFVSEYHVVEFTAALERRACALLEKHPLRAYDSVQLAAALAANEALVAQGDAPLTFLAADDRLRTAAEREGLAVDNPSAHPE